MRCCWVRRAARPVWPKKPLLTERWHQSPPPTQLAQDHLVSNPTSWQRAAYAPEGRILLRAEMVSVG